MEPARGEISYRNRRTASKGSAKAWVAARAGEAIALLRHCVEDRPVTVPQAQEELSVASASIGRLASMDADGDA
ncbi:hypothetical protein [Qipengyuania flava]|uniref:hypothetical protein n=1 Tax=Qipengyuania flava TaxID=192812 RepID=UPI00273F1A1E|nr:hypothetical protein [Qipengyuania flava]